MKVYLLIVYKDVAVMPLPDGENWSDVKVFTSARQRDNAYFAIKEGIVERQDIVVDKRGYRKPVPVEA